MKSFFNKTALVKILALSVPLLSVCFFHPQPEGDASEYLMMQQSFLNHASPEFRQSDLGSYYQLIEDTESEQLNNWFQSVFLRTIQEEEYLGGGYIRGKNGNHYSYHFIFYSLLSVPFRMIGDLAGLNPMFSFLFLNAFSLSFALLIVIRSEKLEFLEKLFLGLVLNGSCFVFYFSWLHPEVFTTSLVLAGIVLYLDKRQLGTAMLCLALASMQNQPVAFMLPILFLASLLQRWRSGKDGLFGVICSLNFKTWLSLFLSGIFVLLPSFYFLYFTGSTNPILQLGGASFDNISLSRLSSFWFDINQGMIVGFAGILAAMALGFICNLLTSSPKSENSTRWISLSILAAIFISSVFCTTQGNWNAGTAGILRYCLWLGIPLAVVLLCTVRELPQYLRWFTLAFPISIQFVTWIIFGAPADVAYLQLNAGSRWILDHYPALYNPDPEIFAERLMGKEEVLYTDALFIRKGHGDLYKVLMRIDSLIEGKIWTENLSLDAKSKVSIWKKPGGWTYVTGEFNKSNHPKTVHFKHHQEDIFISGWSYREKEFRWSLGKKSVIKLFLPQKDYSGLLRIKFTPQGEGKHMTIFLNGHRLKEGFFQGPQNLVLSYDAEFLQPNGENLVEFLVNDPKKSLIKPDPRILGFRFLSLSFKFNDSLN